MGKKENKKIKAVICPVFETSSKLIGDKDIISALEKLRKKGIFKGEQKENMPIFDCKVDRELIFVGLGDKDKLYPKKAFELVGAAVRAFGAKKQLAMELLESELSSDIAKAILEGFYMGQYSFDKYKTEKDKADYSFDIKTNDIKFDFEEAKVLSEATLTCRELANEPSNIIYPESLAKRTKKLGKEYGFEVEVLGKKKIEKLGMEAFLAVSSGSDRDPKLIVMRYMNAPDSDEILGYVGKGITYDSGGYSIKPTKGMVTMNMDMAGGAAVISAITAISRAKLKVNVVAVVAACENLVNGKAYKPGDIIGSMGGKSIFVGNTDAEGRLTLVDGVHYIKTVEKATKIVDIATLTGAAIYTLGSVATSSISNDDKFFESVDKAYYKGAENIHRLPVFEEYKEMLKHPYADLNNIPGNPGTIMAGCFIAEFAGDVPFVHLDIAATGMFDNDKGVYSRGATGAGVRPLYYLAKILSEK